jgi:hypothetical protein
MCKYSQPLRGTEGKGSRGVAVKYFTFFFFVWTGARSNIPERKRGHEGAQGEGGVEGMRRYPTQSSISLRSCKFEKRLQICSIRDQRENQAKRGRKEGSQSYPYDGRLTFFCGVFFSLERLEFAKLRERGKLTMVRTQKMAI